jgi:hypothetical protein
MDSYKIELVETTNTERKYIMNAKDQVRIETMQAMECARPFSWIKARLQDLKEVQMGVYIQHTQEFFQTYVMKKNS